MSDIKNSVHFQLLGGWCNCSAPLGHKNVDHPELPNYLALLKEFQKVKLIKALYLVRYWIGSGRAKELMPVVTVNIEEIDQTTLANMEENTPYRIEYFKRFS